MKITDEINGLVKLILRSTDKGEGWRSVSDVLAESVLLWAEQAPELFEVKQENGLRIRLSEHGKVIATYI